MNRKQLEVAVKDAQRQLDSMPAWKRKSMQAYLAQNDSPSIVTPNCLGSNVAASQAKEEDAPCP